MILPWFSKRCKSGAVLTTATTLKAHSPISTHLTRARFPLVSTRKQLEVSLGEGIFIERSPSPSLRLLMSIPVMLLGRTWKAPCQAFQSNSLQSQPRTHSLPAPVSPHSIYPDEHWDQHGTSIDISYSEGDLTMPASYFVLHCIKAEFLLLLWISCIGTWKLR